MTQGELDAALKKLLELLRITLAGLGITCLLGWGLEAIGPGPSIEVSSFGAILGSGWRLFKAASLIGAAVSLVHIWIDAAELRQQTEFLQHELRVRQVDRRTPQ